jgi:hypothetical protein
MNPTRYTVGQQVYVSRQNYQNVHNSNRSIHAYPSDRFVNIVHELMTKGMTGTVQRTFLPGYEVNVQYTNGTVLQMKDHWITALPDYDAVDFIQ